MRGLARLRTAVALPLLLLGIASASARPSHDVDCPGEPRVGAVIRGLRRTPPPGGFRLAGRGCTLHGGGQFWLSLEQAPGGVRPAVEITVYLARKEALPESYARTPSFAIYFRQWSGPRGLPRVMEAVDAVVARVRAEDHGGPVRFPETSSVPSPAPRAWPGWWIPMGLGLLILALLAFVLPLPAALAGERTGLAAALSASLGVLLLAPPTWMSTAWAVLWLPLAFALGLAAFRARRLERSVLLPLVAVFLLALLVRFAVPAGPINQHTELLGPAGAASAPFERSFSRGLSSIYRLVDGVLPLSDQAIFAIQRLLGALAVALLFWALWARARVARGVSGPWSAAGLLLFGIVLAVEPVQARVAASDCAHVLAYCAWAAAAWLYGEIGRVGRWGPPLLLGLALLPGLLRPELAPTPLLIPLLLGPSRRQAGSWGRLLLGPRCANGVLAFASVAALLVMTSVNPARMARPEPFAAEHLWPWLDALLEELRLHPPGADLDVASASALAGLSPRIFPQQVTLLAAASVFISLLRGRLRPLLVAAFAVGLFGMRLFSGFYHHRLAMNFADARYDIVLLCTLLLLSADGLGRLATWVGERLRSLREPRGLPGKVASWAAGVAVAVAAVALLGLVSAPYAPPYTLRMGWQREYAFAARHLAGAPRDCAVAVVGQPRGQPWPNDVLVAPHPMLAFAGRERRWFVVGSEGGLAGLRDEPCVLYLRGSLCQVGWTEEDDPERPFLERARDLCARLQSAAAETLAEEAGPGVAVERPFVDGTLLLGLYRLDPSRSLGPRRPAPETRRASP